MYNNLRLKIKLMLNKLKKNDSIFFILKNIQYFLKFVIKKIISFSGTEERLSKIESAMTYQFKEEEFLWEKLCLNGQKYRKKIIEDILKNSKFDLILETGTEYGYTSKFLSQFCEKVITIEKSKPIYLIARENLKDNPKIKLILNDSKNILNILGNEKNIVDSKIFFYLDAHSEGDYPLIEELDYIVNNVKEFVILIDDFQVPDDEGYGYDSFMGRKLNIKFIRDVIKQNFSFYFPSISSSEETGRLRGYILITNIDSEKEKLDKIGELKRFIF